MRLIFNKYKIILWLFIAAYTIYFSFFSILRYKTLYSSYYDLGIMNQAVHNTYEAIKQKDFSRILEMTDTDSPVQIKRMAIHNDIFLALLSLFYFIHDGPETLLVIQTIVLALGALAVYGISKHILERLRIANCELRIISLIFSLAYLLYSPMQRANIFDFHAVVLATTFLLFMFYFWLKKKYVWSYVFLILSLVTKENVGLTTAMFGIYTLIFNLKFSIFNENFKFPLQGKQISNLRINKDILYSLSVILLSALWVIISFLVIIPYFRGRESFALGYYDGDGSIITNPANIFKFIFHMDTLKYFVFLLGPLAFFSLFSPLTFLIALPELAINLFSTNWNMRNIIYHYTAVIQPWVFISAAYGVKRLFELKSEIRNPKSETISNFQITNYQNSFNQLKINILKIVSNFDIRYSNLIVIIILFSSLLFSYFKGPLPFTREQEIHPFKYPQKAAKDVAFWADALKDDSIKISASGQVAPLFSSRKYLYLFSNRYMLADYIVIRHEEIYNYPDKVKLIPVYEKLRKDEQFEQIYNNNDLEVYRKI